MSKVIMDRTIAAIDDIAFLLGHNQAEIMHGIQQSCDGVRNKYSPLHSGNPHICRELLRTIRIKGPDNFWVATVPEIKREVVNGTCTISFPTTMRHGKRNKFKGAKQITTSEHDYQCGEVLNKYSAQDLYNVGIPLKDCSAFTVETRVDGKMCIAEKVCTVDGVNVSIREDTFGPNSAPGKAKCNQKVVQACTDALKSQCITSGGEDCKGSKIVSTKCKSHLSSCKRNQTAEYAKCDALKKDTNQTDRVCQNEIKFACKAIKSKAALGLDTFWLSELQCSEGMIKNTLKSYMNAKKNTVSQCSDLLKQVENHLVNGDSTMSTPEFSSDPWYDVLRLFENKCSQDSVRTFMDHAMSSDCKLDEKTNRLVGKDCYEAVCKGIVE